jgi:hypothetical protein
MRRNRNGLWRSRLSARADGCYSANETHIRSGMVRRNRLVRGFSGIPDSNQAIWITFSHAAANCCRQGLLERPRSLLFDRRPDRSGKVLTEMNRGNFLA